MTPHTAAATEAARRFWSHDGKITAPDKMTAEVDRACLELGEILVRWIGPHGYDALLNRALGMARLEHPALISVACRGEDGPGIAAAVRAHGTDAISAGILGLVATVVELLGRVIGEEMAVQILNQRSGSTTGGLGTIDAGSADG